MEAQLFKISNAHAMGPLPPHHVPKLEVLRPSRKLVRSVGSKAGRSFNSLIQIRDLIINVGGFCIDADF
jgi:hypothetical protein